MKPLFLFGDSHTAIYKDGAGIVAPERFQGGAIGGARAFNRPFFEHVGDEIVFTNENVKAGAQLRLQRAGAKSLRELEGRMVVSMGLASGPFVGSGMWRWLDYGDKLHRTKRFLSSGVLHEMIDRAQAPVVAFYRALHDLGLLLAAFEGPPLQLRLRTFRTLPPAKVFELDQMFTQPVRDVLRELGCPIIAAPGLADDQGYLREEFWGHDWVHGNIAYGERTIRALLDHLGPGA